MPQGEALLYLLLQYPSSSKSRHPSLAPRSLMLGRQLHSLEHLQQYVAVISIDTDAATVDGKGIRNGAERKKIKKGGGKGGI